MNTLWELIVVENAGTTVFESATKSNLLSLMPIAITTLCKLKGEEHVMLLLYTEIK